MAAVNINLKADLQHAVRVQYLDGNLFSQDAAANTINIEVTDGGAPATIGGTVSANVIRPDGGTVAVTGGTISGNTVSITLPAACYALVGMISVIVKLTSDSTETTIAALTAYVYQSSTDTVVDPGTVISSIQDLIDAIDTAVASIPADYSSLWTSLAPAFSSSTAYTAGQYVTYNGGLYRFTKAHAAGSWASGDVVAVNLGGELSDVKSAINAEGWSDSNLWEQGNIVSTTGENANGTIYGRMRTKTYIPGNISFIGVESGYWIALFCYSLTTDEYQGMWSGTEPVKSWSDSYIIRSTNVNIKNINSQYRIRVIASKNNAEQLVPATDASMFPFVSVTDETLQKKGVAADAKKTGDQFNVSYQIKGLLTAGTNLNNLFKIGLYRKNGGEGSALLNSPSTVPGTVFALVGVMVGNSTNDNNPSANGIMQVYITNEYGTFTRYYNGSAWGDWIENGGAYSPIRTLVKDEDINNIYVPGVYRKNGGSNTELTNAPEDAPENSFALLVVMAGNPLNKNASSNGIMQFYITIDYVTWIRYYNGSQWGDWKPSGYQPRGTLTYGYDIDDLPGIGVFRKNGGENTEVLHSPEFASKTDFALILSAVGNARNVDPASNGKMQFYITRNSGAYMRYFNGSVWDEWSTFSGEGLVSLGNSDTLKIHSVINLIREVWKPLENIYYEHTEGDVEYYPAGEDLTGIPYSQMTHEGRDIFYNRNLNTFYSSVQNPGSVLYQQPLAWGDYQGANYGAVCSTFTGWLSSQPVSYLTTEMPGAGFEYYDYRGPKSIRPGDIMLSTDPSFSHCIMISDILANPASYTVEYIETVEQTTPWSKVTRRKVADFEDMLQENGGLYRLGRYPNTEIRDVEPVRFANDVIPEMGDQTYYYENDDVYVYVADDEETEIYIRKSTVEQWTTVTLSTLTKKQVNGVYLYDISAYLNENATYYVTTNKDNTIYCTITRVDVGSISVSGSTVTLSGYSANVSPVYRMILALTPGSTEGTIYQHPEGYKAIPVMGSKQLVDADTFTIEELEDVDGFYVRVYYETGFGQAYTDSDYVWFN